jgi:hypothetical protein
MKCIDHLQGNCSSSVPVGAVGFADSVERSNHQSCSSSSSSIHTETGGSNGNDIHSESPDNVPGSCSLQTHTSRLLGVSADAGWCQHAHLPGVGSLLPAWRQIAHLLAPLCHQVLPQSFNLERCCASNWKKINHACKKRFPLALPSLCKDSDSLRRHMDSKLRCRPLGCCRGACRQVCESPYFCMAPAAAARAQLCTRRRPHLACM